VITFKIINQSERKPCFVGTGSMSTAVHVIVSQQHNCEIATVEDLMSKNDQWFNQHSFIVISSDIKFKMHTVDYLDARSATYFSVINQHNNIDSSTQIGAGCCVFSFNDMTVGPVSIGQHSIIGNHNVFAHNTILEDFCHSGHFGFFSHCHIGRGTVLGVRPSLLGPTNRVLQTADFCNFISGSTITKDIKISGTYYGNRLLHKETSLTKRIL